MFNQTTYNLSLGIAIVFALYTLIYSGLTGVLVCSSVALTNTEASSSIVIMFIL